MYPVASLKNQETIIRKIDCMSSALNEVLEGEARKRAKSDLVTAVKSAGQNFRVCWLSNQVICTTCEKYKYLAFGEGLPADLDKVGKFDIGPALNAARRRTLLQSLERHSNVETHRRCREFGERAQKDKTNIIRMNVARMAYVTITEGDSFRRFERNLSVLALSGALVGDLNHSRKFISSFAICLKEELLARLSYLITAPRGCFGDKPSPMGAATDKVTLGRRTLQAASVSTLVDGKITVYLVDGGKASIPPPPIHTLFARAGRGPCGRALFG